MGLAANLGYTHSRPKLLQRSVQAFAHTLARMDRVATRLTGVLTSVPRLMAGPQALTLTTTGRRSGHPPESLLIAVPIQA